jgi:hypothetical protein
MMKSLKKIALLGSLACAVLAGAPAFAQTVERIYPPRLRRVDRVG